jgi:hypothetical protein
MQINLQKNVNKQIPQFRVRSNLTAGESVDACMNNVAYWQKQYVDKCKKQGVIVRLPSYS